MAVASSPDQAEYGGYDFTFTKPVPEKFYCSICTKVLRDPHFTECCGQYFCESCLKHWFKKQKNTCPHCCHENFIHILNKPLKREVDEFEIRCTKQGVGCQWVGELSSLQAHLESDKGCGYVEVQCSNKCGLKMKRKDLIAHLGWQCPLRKIKCKYCHYEDTHQTITSQHYKKCPCYPLPCPNNCGTTDIQRADMANHCSKCELEPVECLFHEAGSTAQVVCREFDAHMSGSQQDHLLALLGAFQETKRALSESQRQLGECQTKLSLVEAVKSPPTTLMKWPFAWLISPCTNKLTRSGTVHHFITGLATSYVLQCMLTGRVLVQGHTCQLNCCRWKENMTTNKNGWSNIIFGFIRIYPYKWWYNARKQNHRVKSFP